MAGERTLPGLGLTGFWNLGSNGWKDDMDTNLRVLSALVQARVESRVTALPGSPSLGDMYIVPSGGDADKIAVWDGDAGSEDWVYLTPSEGWMVYVLDEDSFYVYDGTDWTEFASGTTAGSDISDALDSYFGNELWRKDPDFLRPNVPQRDFFTNYPWVAGASAADSTWRDLIWVQELGLFVAVAASGTGTRVMTSPDGITWTLRTSASDNNWTGVAWSKELHLLVAVAASGTGDRVMTSPDGITWTSRTSAADNNWQAVTWSPELGLFVAVGNTGSGNRSMSSPDGINWTAGTTPSRDFLSVCWSPDKMMFVAVSSNGTGTRAVYSTDGSTWTTATSAEDNSWSDVVWGKEAPNGSGGFGLFVAVATDGTNRVMTSPDGITWTARSAAAANAWQCVVWAAEIGLFIAVASSGTGNRVMTSRDGVTWTSRTSGADNSWRGLAWSKQLGICAAVGTSGTGNRVMYTVSAYLQSDKVRRITISTTTYTLTNLDLSGNIILVCTHASGCTITIPSGLVGTEPVIVRRANGAGDVTFSASSTTLRSPSGYLKIGTAHGHAFVDPVGSNEYYIEGRLAA